MLVGVESWGWLVGGVLQEGVRAGLRACRWLAAAVCRMGWRNCRRPSHLRLAPTAMHAWPLCCEGTCARKASRTRCTCSACCTKLMLSSGATMDGMVMKVHTLTAAGWGRWGSPGAGAGVVGSGARGARWQSTGAGARKPPGRQLRQPRPGARAHAALADIRCLALASPAASSLHVRAPFPRPRAHSRALYTTSYSSG